MTNKPLQADQETSAKIHRRVELAIESESGTIGFAYPELHPSERKREMAWAAIRWGQRMLEELRWSWGDGEDVPEPGKPRSEQDVDPGEVLVPLPPSDKPKNGEGRP